MESSSGMLSVFGSLLSAELLVPIPCSSTIESGRYRLEELISMGVRSWVYKAVDITLSSANHDDRVIVKVYKSRGCEHESLLTRRVNHENVVRVLSRGVTDDGYPYVAMEFVPGGSLSGQSVPWDARKAVAFVRELAAAVQAAHDAGIVHCDIKPDNVLVTQSGRPKLIDFELAASDLSDSRTPRGTRAFMSPEQAAGAENALTAPSDVYALGGVLYYLLTGTHASELESGRRAAVLRAELRRSRAPNARHLAACCLKALEYERERRFTTPRALAQSLQCWAEFRIPEDERTSPFNMVVLAAQRQPAMAVALICGVVMLVCTAAALTWWRYDAAEQKLEVERQALRLASQQVEATRAVLRGTVREMHRGLVKSTGASTDSVLPTLVWLDWIADNPAFQPGEAIPPSERLEALKELRAGQSESDGEAGIEGLLLAYAIAQLELAHGDAQRTQEETERILDEWSTVLQPNDRLLTRTRLLLACAQAELSTTESREGAVAHARELWDVAKGEASRPFHRLVTESLARASSARDSEDPHGTSDIGDRVAKGSSSPQR